MISRKSAFAVGTVALLLAITLIASSCGGGGGGGSRCVGPRAINGMCHTSCGSPPECHYAYPGEKAGCKLGQVCNDACACTWVDKDLDGFPVQNFGDMSYVIDCEDEDPTVFPSASEICDNKDNNCTGGIDEGSVCERDVFFCKTKNFDDSSNACSDGAWCSTATDNSSASCIYQTTDRDIGSKPVHVFVCDDYFVDGDYGCYYFTQGSFTGVAACNNNNFVELGEECDGSNINSLKCEDFGYSGGILKCDHCTYDFNACTGIVCSHDNIKDLGEECDGSDLGGKRCELLGFGGGNLKCTNSCLFDTSSCKSSKCGNAVIDSSEDCDGSNLNGRSCLNYGYLGGSLLCDVDCSFDFSSCLSSVCNNNGNAEPGEACDNSDLDGKSCASFGFSGGSLKCASDCEFDFSGCAGYSCDKDGIVESGEACDGSELNGKDCRFFDMYRGGLLKCDIRCMFDTSGCSLVCDNDNSSDVGEECDGSDLRGKSCYNFNRYGGILKCSPSCFFDLSSCGPSCLEEWTCTPWSYCSSMYDNTTRVCADSKGCGTSFSKPDEVKACDSSVCVDDDGDGYCACQGDSLGCDCDDSDSSVHPGISDVCNDNDDNCDGTVDEGCPCEQDSERSCGVTLGVCREGIQTCVLGYWSLCSGPGHVGPQTEVCGNGLDENCDSYPDDGCSCDNNSTQECGSDVGECKKGTQVCFDGNWSACTGSEDPFTEVCNNNKDDDCDSQADCEDSSCSVSVLCAGSTGNVFGTGSGTCFDKEKNNGEAGIDCGGPCPSCEKMCGFGQVTKACICEGVVRTSGYCCDGKYELISCEESCSDSDDDTLCDSDEIRMGSDPNNSDTDGDGVPDSEDDLPLCNKDGKCDSSKEYPEGPDNCPDDCSSKASVGKLWWIILLLVLAITIPLVFYILVKKGVIKFKGKKKEQPKLELAKVFKPTIQPVEVKARDISSLVSYFERSLKKNIPKSKLEESASKAGWSKEEIRKALDLQVKPKVNKKFFSLFKK